MDPIFIMLFSSYLVIIHILMQGLLCLFLHPWVTVTMIETWERSSQGVKVPKRTYIRLWNRRHVALKFFCSLLLNSCGFPTFFIEFGSLLNKLSPSMVLSKWQCCYTNHFCLSWLHLCISIGFVSVLEIFIFHFVKIKLRSQQHPVNSLHFQSFLHEKDGCYEAVFLLYNWCRMRPTELLACNSWIGNLKGHNLTECVYGYYLPD